MEYSERKKLLNEVYYDALMDYNSNPDEFVRRVLDYDELMELIFLRGTVKMERVARKLLPFIDLSSVNFYGIDVSGVDFSKTNAIIDPQTVYKKNLRGCCFDGLDMSMCNFDGCDIRGTSFVGTICEIDPSKVIGFDDACFEGSRYKGR